MDPKKIKELYEKYGFLIYGRCIRILQSKDDAKDAMQDIFLKLMDKYEKFKEKEHIVPWIYTVSRNHCFNILRQKKKFVDSNVIDSLNSNEHIDQNVAEKDLIKKIFNFHNKRVQEAVYYTFIEKLNQQDIQKITGQSPATIRRNLKKFKESLPHIKKRLGI